MPSPGRGRAEWSTSAASAAPPPSPLPSTHAATSSATATPQETPATTRRSGTPRQRRRELNSMRILGAVALAVLLTGAAGASTGLARAAGPTVTAIDLGTLGGNFSEALDMNASGQVIGESA